VGFGARRFEALWRRRIASPPSPGGAAVYRRLAGSLEEPSRHYHTLEHIRDCVERADSVADRLEDADAVELALWFHDTLLTPGAPDNERRSTRLFLELAGGAAPALRCRVARLILATRHVRAATGGDRAYIVDIDLAGLAAPWDRFMHAGELLRREAPHQSDAEFYRGQVAFLGALLERRYLYATEHFRARCEAPARANLARLLALRASQGYVAPGSAGAGAGPARTE
jgi:predicted metal-dependent HD superfamily phosphohydrolase